MGNREDNVAKTIGSTDFLITFQFRQNADWQGEVIWFAEDGEHKIFFRSLLELIGLMQEALGKEGRVRLDEALRTWGAAGDGVE